MAVQIFDDLVKQSQPTGKVIASNKFFAIVDGLQSLGLNNQVLFDNGHRGLVWSISDKTATILSLDSESVDVGASVVFEKDVFTAKVGKNLLGRVITVDGQPLDGKGALDLRTHEPVFKTARPIIQRRASDEQLVTGVTVVDTIFPVVLGQRVAVIGDARTGKSSFLAQIASRKARQRVCVYVLINKRKADVQNLLRQLDKSGGLTHSVVIVADVYSSLAQAYLAPYVGCAVAEYLRDEGNDVVVIYDDLTNHAKIYRQIALQIHTSAGRDSYPSDIFYSHSSLLERAGCFADSPHSITALPVVVSPDDDITGYLATNLMSITDGQLIFARQDFQEGQRPAINTGLSVSRIGGRARSSKIQQLVGLVQQKLADYQKALEFSHFEAGQTATSKVDLTLGQRIFAIFRQELEESYSILQQQIMLEAALRVPIDQNLDVDTLKKAVKTLGSRLSVSNYNDHLKSLLGLLVASKPTQAPAAAVES